MKNYKKLEIMIKYITLFILILLTACNTGNVESSKRKANVSKVKSAIQEEKVSEMAQDYTISKEQLEEERRQQILDSINFDRTLRLGLRIANKKKDKNKFTLQSDSLTIRYGYLFTPNEKHLIIRRTFPIAVQTDIYKLQNNEFVNVCSKEMHPMAFIDDTIQDVNGDKLGDYLFHWYPMSGCCERNIYDVFLLKDNGDFTNEIEFINPIFSAKEKVIRGRRYGHEAPLYKFKWNGFKIDTIEFVYFPSDMKNGKYIKRKHENVNEKGEVLKKLPEEYRKIGYGY